jgi:hypothetical protein
MAVIHPMPALQALAEMHMHIYADASIHKRAPPFSNVTG